MTNSSKNHPEPAAETKGWIGAAVVYDHHDGVNNSNAAAFAKLSRQEQMFWSDDPRIWQRWR